MGVSIYTEIVGIIPKDKKYETMLEIYKTCQEADVTVPVEVLKYFHQFKEDFEENFQPSKDGLEAEIKEAITKYGEEEYGDGATYMIDLSAIPENIKKLQVKVSFC